MEERHSDSRSNPLGIDDTRKLLVRFAVPSIIAMLVSSLYNIVDQIFIGQGVGYLGNAATNVAYPFSTICLSIALLIGIGSAANFNLSLGAKDEETAARTVGNAVILLAVLGLSLMTVTLIFSRRLIYLFGCTPEIEPYAMTYVRICALGFPALIFTNGLSSLARADGSPRYSMAMMLLGAVINTILDPVFIFVFDWGIAGAAWATIIGQYASCILGACYLGRFRTVALAKSAFRFSHTIGGRICQLGLSNSLNQLAMTLVQIVLNNSLTYYGALSVYGAEIPLASSGIVIKLNSIMISIVVGINQGNQPILSFNYGAKKYSRVKKAYFNGIAAGLVVTCTGYLLANVFPDEIISFFGRGNALYMQFAVRFLRYYMTFSFLNSVQLLTSNYFAAIGFPMKGVFLSLTRQVILLIPIVLVLPLFLGLDGILYATPAADLLSFLIAVALMAKEMGRMKHLIAHENDDITGKEDEKA